ncbi:hypothetical protein C0991_012521 [Blastosporella zonata]|nr:hypothetical protein C0991_012521 [Blastosporella zonata]
MVYAPAKSNESYDILTSQHFTMVHALFLAVFLAPNFLAGVAAMPTVPPNKTVLAKRDDSDHKGTSIQIWIPVAIVGAIIVVGVLGLCWRTSISAWFDNRRRPAAANAETRELTAEQLAGTINGTTPATGVAANRTRRTRRPRRTPSQISTTSLPAYAKEPGEQELVIFRGPEDMEDAGMPTATVVMESLLEDGEESMHSRNHSRASQYPEIPVTPIDEPLLNQNQSSGDLSAQLMSPPGNVMNRRSMDTLHSSEEGSSLAPAYDDDRGEAPAYFEVIENISPTVSTNLPSSQEPIPPTRTGFRTLLHSIPNRLSMYSASHTRAESSFSMTSSDISHAAGRETSQSRASHRPSNSGSGSILNLTPFRTLSRQSNVNNLTSPSLISLNSISSPLTHTLTRTEFTYPKSGPTPEQLKLISSRDGFTRFAVPYGADAIAYAASASRQDLNDVPPPDFDAPTPGSAGPSRLRASSSAADMSTTEVSSTSPSQQDNSSESISTDGSSIAAASPTRRTSSSSLASPNAVSESSEPDPVQIPLPSSPVASEGAPEPQSEITPLVLPKPSTIVSGAPPTAFRAPSAFGDHSESRASSVASFATAVESVAAHMPSGFDIPSDDEDGEELETPTTPRIGSGHALEPTDTTIKQSPRSAVDPPH